ncbi:MAG: DUF1553 domain-containing protein [Planctomycetes bacterium]|nr:DUF1553 domain-containing protein [Planctomycetota bacterium]
MFTRIGLVVVAFAISPPLQAAPPEPARKIDFNRDVRPILSDNCFHCHGPDEKTRKAKLRLDTKEGIQDAKADVLARVSSKDPHELMPPAKSGKQLTAAQIDTLKAWVSQGATWSSHWAFTAPVRPKPTIWRDSGHNNWLRNPIDNFIMDGFDREGLEPSPEADKITLLRRVTLDLTGVPPTPEEVDAFLKDTSPKAYETVVDRLLASPRFGERMAWRWLEAARYSDTNGYQTDAGRDMWRWRDWVIEAYNRNLPFDQFTIEQIAGDLLPKPTLDQRIATGFNRNHRGNSEGGIVPEEYAVEYVADRVETTATVWLGLTFTCCRCHDHKFDPISQREFYQLFAYFNNVPEKGRAVKFGNSPPFIKAPTREEEKALAEFDARVREAEKRVAEVQDLVPKAQAEWEKAADPTKLEEWWPRQRGSHAVVALGKATEFDGKHLVDAGDLGNGGFDDPFTLACRIKPRTANGAILSRTPEKPQADGYSVHLVNGKVQVHLTKRWLDDALRVETLEALPLNQWSHIAVTYDASRSAAGTIVYIDGVEAKTRVLLDELNQSFDTKEPFRIGSGGGPDSRFNGTIDDVWIYNVALEPAEVRLVAVAESVAAILRKPAAKRTAPEADKLRAYFIDIAAPGDIRKAYDALRLYHNERRNYWSGIQTVMVMEEMPTTRDAHILIRGEYDKKGPKVQPGVPAALSPLPKDVPNNRLGFAKWLASKENPLTARVAVNRAWQMHFGVGLVKTAEDFGTQGAFPTHPKLLDWLAVEFATDWDVKRLHKLIVMSATYRQASRITKESLVRDPENKLLSRFPRLRLSAEMLRDQALFASGLLVEKQGGPSVKPYQPAGLWKELSGADDYKPEHGEKLYRRSLYTYWKRTSPPPALAAFDASGRETCWVRENRTNTPLQALTLLNETAFVEAARMLAQRVMLEAKEPDDRLTLAFRRVTGRRPTSRELGVLRKSLDFQIAEFRANPKAAAKLLAIGESKPDRKLDSVELAAYSAVCNLLLNLDEVVTKE